MINELLLKANKAKEETMLYSNEDRNKALLSIADILSKNTELIINENKKDLENAINNKISNAMINRLKLDEKKINSIINDIKQVASLPDVLGEIIEEFEPVKDLNIKKIRVPFGVILTIYESRPNVSVDIASLCIKTGNVCILKGGKEAFNTNLVLVKLMKEAIKEFIPSDTILLVESTDREVVNELLTRKEEIDLVVPRGSKGLINFVLNNSKVPVIETGAGVCHLYVDEDADLDMATKIIINAKISNPSVCNAVETVLINKKHLNYLETLKNELINNNVIINGNNEIKKYIDCNLIDDNDYYTEYNDMIINLKLVDNINDAIKHIKKYYTQHSDGIITNNLENRDKFFNLIDSACVYHNASTRFTDGGCFGFGAELGISTQKLHARGPMGLKEMTSYKYIIYGKGNIR